MKKIELLSPVGDFKCLKAAVQNGADTVYFGSSFFSARASAVNFNLDELKSAIDYCTLRNVKTNLTLNTLIKNDEFNDALFVAEKAYEYGIDAIIVQDLGLAKYLLKNLPDLPIHASTQMTIHNLEGALELQKLGFKRIVLSRELSINEIAYICRNTSVEIEVFVHGALCVSYSGQCLFSSIVGGRSGNRGRCAGPCRLPYTLNENIDSRTTKLDSGYLLSTRDVCGLNYIPDLINCGVSCLKIEGRLKSPEYVATVTRIYRKYIDMHYAGSPYKISPKDTTDLLQVFNRGGFSEGHLNNDENRDLIYKEKPNHQGLFLGKIFHYNKNKGIIHLTLNNNLAIGDSITFENEPSLYTISELLIDNKNTPTAVKKDKVSFGRMKGNISVGDKVYKITDKHLNELAHDSFKGENKKYLLYCTITLKKNVPIVLNLHSIDDKYNISVLSSICPEEAKNSPITEERIVSQLSRTADSPFEFKDINVEMEDNLFIPKISILNELRRNALSNLADLILSKKERHSKMKFPNDKKVLENVDLNKLNSSENYSKHSIEKSLDNTELSDSSLSNAGLLNKKRKLKISVLLQTLNTSFDYSLLTNVENIYIPFKYFLKNTYKNIITTLSEKGNLYIYMPTIIKNNYKNLFFNNIPKILDSYEIKGFVLSNIGDLVLLKDYQNYDFVGNYTLNVFNSFSNNELYNLGLSKLTFSSELNKASLITSLNNCKKSAEVMVYGNIPIMNLGYCLLGKTNKCYPSCSAKCKDINKTYFLTDRLKFNFKVVPDNFQTITSIYNSKITSIDFRDLPTNLVRLNILDESIDEINSVIYKTLNFEKVEGTGYTNGNFNREI